jgi:threonine synthase
MDISKASNFERFVFDLVGRDAAQLWRASWAELRGLTASSRVAGASASSPA